MTPRALKKWRRLLELTQVEFGTWLGVSRSTVNRWEGGTQSIPHMVGLLKREHTANEPNPTDTECGCIRGVQACDYHAAGNGGRWREDEGIGHARITGQENYDHENQHQPPLENPMDWEK